jgi:GntR family transcriptional regulator
LAGNTSRPVNWIAVGSGTAMKMLNRNSKVPLYQQLYETLRGDVLSNRLQPGDLLPPELELADRYHVSNITVRQALDMLHKEGLIRRHRGRGTFVAHPRLDQNLMRIVSFTQDMPTRGLAPTSRVLGSSLIPAPDDIAEKLLIEPGEELARLERLRLADGEPMSIEVSHLIHRLCPGILRKHDYAVHSLREALERDYGIRTARARQTIRAVTATANLARALGIRANSALLYIERVTYSQDDVPIEFLRIYYRGDRYVLHNELNG